MSVSGGLVGSWRRKADIGTLTGKRNDEEGAKEKLYSYVQAVNVKNPKGLVTTVVEE